jgi:hypothetical protein
MLHIRAVAVMNNPTSLALAIVIMVWSLAAAGAAHASGIDPAGGVAPAYRETERSDAARPDFKYFKGYITDTGAVLASPLTWGRSGWLKLALVCGITFAVGTEDREVQSWVQSRRNDDTDMVSQYSRAAGSGKYVLPGLCALYGCGWLTGSDRVARTALLSLESVVISGLLTGGVKYLTHKQRPGAARGEDIEWQGPGLYPGNISFPSGHSTSGFAVATIVASEFDEYSFVPPLAYLVAALVAFSRVNDNVHWASDVILGSAVGHFTAAAIAARHGVDRPSKFSLTPQAGGGYVGLMLSYRF